MLNTEAFESTVVLYGSTPLGGESFDGSAFELSGAAASGRKTGRNRLRWASKRGCSSVPGKAAASSPGSAVALEVEPVAGTTGVVTAPGDADSIDAVF